MTASIIGLRSSRQNKAAILNPSLQRVLFCVTVCVTFDTIAGHGRLVEPPSRSTMWRYGFHTPPNYNDHELFCGGLSRMIRNGGKCGICGDPADSPSPRANEVGGIYANGIVVRRYKVNQIIESEVEITAYHKGYLEFKICPTNDPKVDPTQECFDRHVLRLADNRVTQYYLPDPPPDQKYKMRYALPKWMTCSFCVIQWTYVAGNNWGRCANGTEGIGCGHQETFRACADVTIGDGSDVETNEIPQSSHSSTSHTFAFSSLFIVINISFVICYSNFCILGYLI